MVAISVILKCLFTHNQPHSQKGIYRMLQLEEKWEIILSISFCVQMRTLQPKGGNDLLKVKQFFRALDST